MAQRPIELKSLVNNNIKYPIPVHAPADAGVVFQMDARDCVRATLEVGGRLISTIIWDKPVSGSRIPLDFSDKALALGKCRDVIVCIICASDIVPSLHIGITNMPPRGLDLNCDSQKVKLARLTESIVSTPRGVDELSYKHEFQDALVSYRDGEMNVEFM